MKNRTYSDTVFNTIDYISTLIIFLLTTKLFLAQLGTDGYGFYMFFNSLIGTFGLVDIGMGMVVSKYLSEFLHQNKISESNQVVSQAIIFYSIAGLTLGLLVNIFSESLLNIFNFSQKYAKLGEEVLFVTSIIFAINLFISIATNVMVALEKWRLISIMNIIFKIISAFLMVAILLSNNNYEYKIIFIFYSLLLVAIVKFACYGWFAHKLYPDYKWQKPKDEIRNNIQLFLKWSSIQYGLSLMVGHADKIVITRFFGLETLGVYSFVVNAFVYLFGFLNSAFKIFFPKLSKMHAEQDIVRLKSYFSKLIVGSIVVSIIIGSVSLILWKPFVGAYIDTKFADASFLYFATFILYLIIRGPEVIFSYFFNATAKPDVLVKNVAVGSITTLVSYFALVPVFQAYGLIFAQMIGSLSIYAFVFYKINKNGFYSYAKL